MTNVHPWEPLTKRLMGYLSLPTDRTCVDRLGYPEALNLHEALEAWLTQQLTSPDSSIRKQVEPLLLNALIHQLKPER